MPPELLQPVLLTFGLLVLVCLAWAIFWRATAFPYEAANPLLSASERAFYTTLRKAVGADYALFIKVRLADIIQVESGLTGKGRSSAFNRIKAKHVDFVVCDPETFRVVCAIELDDRSHRQQARQERDDFVDAALAAAEVPILHVPTQKSYSPDKLRQQVLQAVRGNSVTARKITP